MPFDTRGHRPPAPLAAIFLLCLGASAVAAHAQTSADLTLVSAYTARGLTLAPHPAAQLRVEHDFDAGWYAGAFASPVLLDGRRQGQLIAYGGVARRITSALSWDAGVTRTAFLRDGASDYHEFYAGLTWQRLNARLSVSPSYYGEGRTAYLDLTGGQPLTDRLSVALHAGWLHPFGGYEETPGEPAPGSAPRNGVDARAALVYDVGDWTLQAGVQAGSRAYLAGVARARALTVGASLHF